MKRRLLGQFSSPSINACPILLIYWRDSNPDFVGEYCSQWAVVRRAGRLLSREDFWIFPQVLVVDLVKLCASFHFLCLAGSVNVKQRLRMQASARGVTASSQRQHTHWRPHVVSTRNGSNGLLDDLDWRDCASDSFAYVGAYQAVGGSRITGL